MNKLTSKTSQEAVKRSTFETSRVRSSLLIIAVAAALAGCGSQQNTYGKSTNAQANGAAPDFSTFDLRAVIAVPGRPLTAYDISWVDHPTQTYYLADRSNAGIDIVSAETNTFIGRVTGFVGADPRGNDFSGPNGVLEVHSAHELWAGDGPGTIQNSSVKVIDLLADPPQVVDTIFTGGTRRSDEMAHDPANHILAVVNNADDPPFLTLISTQERRVLHRLTFDAALGAPFGVTAFTDGLEQPAWDPETHRFYLSVPELDGVAEHGAIAVINPLTARVTHLFRVNNCHPAGLTLGPNQHLLIGCSDPSRSVVMSAEDGSIVAEITQVGGSDEVWFNSSDNHYYLAARNNPGGAKLGVIDAETNQFTTSVTTAFNAHSVAVNENDSHVFVPLGPPRAGHPTDPNRCVDVGGPSFTGRGCIGVFFRSDASQNEE